METYNDYTKEEDFALWELHTIRRKMAKQKIDLKKIHATSQDIIKKYKLKNLRFVTKKK